MLSKLIATIGAIGLSWTAFSFLDVLGFIIACAMIGIFEAKPETFEGNSQ